MLPKIRAENYFKESNWSTPIVLSIESSPQEGNKPDGAIYGLVVVAVLIAVLLVTLIVMSLLYYWQRRRDKVVFQKVSPHSGARQLMIANFQYLHSYVVDGFWPAKHWALFFFLFCRILKQSGILVARIMIQKPILLIHFPWMSGRYHQSR